VFQNEGFSGLHCSGHAHSQWPFADSTPPYQAQADNFGARASACRHVAMPQPLQALRHLMSQGHCAWGATGYCPSLLGRCWVSVSWWGGRGCTRKRLGGEEGSFASVLTALPRGSASKQAHDIPVKIRAHTHEATKHTLISLLFPIQ